MPLFWNQRTQTGTESLPLSHRPALTRTQTDEARKTQAPPSSLNREPFQGIRPLYKHPRQLMLSLQHQKAASCLV